jgi:hypothetical protein
MVDVTVRTIDEMDGLFGGVMRRARAELGVTAWGMQVISLPAGWENYPDHNHDADAMDPNQEEVYIPIEGSATLVAGGQEFALTPGVMARVGPAQMRKIVPGNAGIRFIAIGGTPGEGFEPRPWSELGAPPPQPSGQ